MDQVEGAVTAPVEATPAELLRLLRRMVDSGAVRLELDLRRLDHMDSPVGIEADSNIWIYPAIIACGLVFWFFGLQPGIAAVVACLGLYLTLGRAYVRRRLVRRIHERALSDLDLWRRLWRFGGLALVPESDPASPKAPSTGSTATARGEPCAAPEGNWMALVRSIAPTARL